MLLLDFSELIAPYSFVDMTARTGVRAAAMFSQIARALGESVRLRIAARLSVGGHACHCADDRKTTCRELRNAGGEGGLRRNTGRLCSMPAIVSMNLRRKPQRRKCRSSVCWRQAPPQGAFVRIADDADADLIILHFESERSLANPSGYPGQTGDSERARAGVLGAGRC